MLDAAIGSAFGVLVRLLRTVAYDPQALDDVFVAVRQFIQHFSALLFLSDSAHMSYTGDLVCFFLVFFFSKLSFFF